VATKPREPAGLVMIQVSLMVTKQILRTPHLGVAAECLHGRACWQGTAALRPIRDLRLASFTRPFIRERGLDASMYFG